MFFNDSMHEDSSKQRILAIQPSSDGCGFAVLQGPRFRLIDWGVRVARGGGKNKRCLKLVEELIRWYEPHVVVTEDYAGEGSRRHPRVQHLIKAIGVLAPRYGAMVRQFSRSRVRQTFSNEGVLTKQEIAARIAQSFPELADRLPPPRKIWKSEDYRMGIFDAVSFALTYFDSVSKRKRTA